MNLNLIIIKPTDSQGKYILMTDVGNPLFYVAQSGLLGEGLPTHKSKFMSAQQSYQMDSDKLIQVAKSKFRSDGKKNI